MANTAAEYIDRRTVNMCIAGIESSLHTMALGYKSEAIEEWITRLADAIETGLEMKELDQ